MKHSTHTHFALTEKNRDTKMRRQVGKKGSFPRCFLPSFLPFQQPPILMSRKKVGDTSTRGISPSSSSFSSSSDSNHFQELSNKTTTTTRSSSLPIFSGLFSVEDDCKKQHFFVWRRKSHKMISRVIGAISTKIWKIKTQSGGRFFYFRQSKKEKKG